MKKALAVTLDRLENGDFFYDQKTGKVKRKPVSMTDAHRVAVDLMSRREVLRNAQADRKEEIHSTVQDQLAVLAKEFARWVEKKPTTILEPAADAVYEERPQNGAEYEGLQTGTPMGEDNETGTPRSSSGEEQSSEDDGTSWDGE